MTLAKWQLHGGHAWQRTTGGVLGSECSRLLVLFGERPLVSSRGAQGLSQPDTDDRYCAACDRPFASPNCFRRFAVLERRVRDHVHRWSKIRNEPGGRPAGAAAHRDLRIPIELREREVHRHDHKRSCADQSDGSATRSIHLGWVVVDANQRFPMGLHDARRNRPMESSPSRRALHASTRRVPIRHHAHRDPERRVPGHRRDAHDGRARVGSGCRRRSLRRKGQRPSAWAASMTTSVPRRRPT